MADLPVIYRLPQLAAFAYYNLSKKGKEKKPRPLWQRLKE
jgi:hypothetical protein